MIEQFMDLLWMALAAMPFAMGFSGGGGGQQASPPKLDVAGSLKLSQGQINQLLQNAPEVARTLGAVGRSEQSANTLYGLNMLTNPDQALRQDARTQGVAEAEKQRVAAMKHLRNQRNYGRIDDKKFEARKSQIKQQFQNQSNKARQQANAMRPLQDLRKTFAAEFGDRNKLIGDMQKSLGSTAEYSRLQKALGTGVTAQQASMERMRAQETGQGALGARLMQEAMAKMEQGGQLSPEAARDATQAARSGMAARGMATGNAGMAAELLNRDRYSRQREFENLGFAQNVEAADLGRRTQNTMNRQQAGMQNAQAFNQLSQFNTGMRADTDRYNMGLLGQSAGLADAERGRQLGTQQDIYNFRLSTNPRMMLAGLGQPYANLQVPGLQQLGGIVGGGQPQYSGGSFSSGGGMGMAGNIAGGAAGGALMGAPLGPWGMAAGAVVGGGMGALSSRQ